MGRGEQYDKKHLLCMGGGGGGGMGSRIKLTEELVDCASV